MCFLICLTRKIELGDLVISWSSAMVCACWRTRLVVDVGSVSAQRIVASNSNPQRYHLSNTDACIISALGWTGTSSCYLIWKFYGQTWFFHNSCLYSPQGSAPSSLYPFKNEISRPFLYGTNLFQMAIKYVSSRTGTFFFFGMKKAPPSGTETFVL